MSKDNDCTDTSESSLTLTPPPLPSDPNFTFTQIIDADHFTIRRLASQIRKLIYPLLPHLQSTNSSSSLAPPPIQFTLQNLSSTLFHLKPLLLETTWRLIRHDFSEDLVMRPAFISVLGTEGERMAQHDRQDHAQGRKALLSIIASVNALDHSLQPGSSEHEQDTTTEQLGGIVEKVTETLDELGKHMQIESGEFLPYFESVISSVMSRRLCEEYAATLIMTPRLMDAEGTARFPGGVVEYVNADAEVMKAHYRRMLVDASSDLKARQHVQHIVRQEIDQLQVEKWISVNERKASRSTAGEEAKMKMQTLCPPGDGHEPQPNERERLRRSGSEQLAGKGKL